MKCRRGKHTVRCYHPVSVPRVAVAHPHPRLRFTFRFACLGLLRVCAAGTLFLVASSIAQCTHHSVPDVRRERNLSPLQALHQVLGDRFRLDGLHAGTLHRVAARLARLIRRGQKAGGSQRGSEHPSPWRGDLHRCPPTARIVTDHRSRKGWKRARNARGRLRQRRAGGDQRKPPERPAAVATAKCSKADSPTADEPWVAGARGKARPPVRPKKKKSTEKNPSWLSQHVDSMG